MPHRWILCCAFILVTMAAMLTTAQADTSQWPEKLTFGVIPVASSRNMSETFGNLTAYLEKQLGLKIELQTAGDYAGVITGMEHKHIDLAYLGPKSYVEAAKRAGAEAVGIEIGLSGIAGYNGYIITKKDSGLNSIADLKGKKWAFTDPHSTSGTLVPTIYFNQQGIDPQQYFSKVIYSGSHESSILSVKAGKVDGASTNNLDFDRGVGKQWTKNDFNIIWQSDLIPGSPIAVRGDLPVSLKMAIKGALVSYDDPQGLEQLKLKGYLAGNDQMYDGVRKLIAMKKALKEQQAKK
ncbi:MAG: phosphonate ABC transporter substrate-binding protein [Deltaproteobacteria bacterium]|nr:phosphonate ABC transporter substrate-binding protein [Candidatus Anaeroferrophillus wilburensis]MBN2890192.1 phosphonate ABC transporter substrate-binding protein [Deltaproteobacteria bacterium]